MRVDIFKRLLMLFLVSLVSVAPVIGTTSVGRQPGKEHRVAPDPQGVSFNLNRLPENPRQYSLVISDDDEHVVSGNFSVEQLQILRAIMTEAEKFALNGEAVGTKDSVTTRFADKLESAFIVDVEKLGNQSELFLTLKSDGGRMTMKAGKIIRSNGREEGFFFDLLTRLESLLPKLPAPTSR